MNNYPISVIIPLYNKENTISRALRSIIKQNELPNEIIIINDGSTDQSANMVQKFDDPIIKLINQENKGVAFARNRGIAEAKHDLIAFLDADDEWLPDYLSTIKKLIHQYPDAIGYGTSYFLKFNDGSMKNIHLERIKSLNTFGLLDNYFEVSNHSDPPICSSAICVKKKFLIAAKGFPAEVKLGEDLLTWARLAMAGVFAYSVTPLAIYYQRTVNTLPVLPPLVDVVGNKLLEIYRNSSKEDKHEIRKYIAKWHKMRAAHFLIRGKEVEGIKEIFISLWFNPTNFKVIALLFLLPLPARLRFSLLFLNKFKK